jgi:hypothetical protein
MLITCKQRGQWRTATFRTGSFRLPKVGVKTRRALRKEVWPMSQVSSQASLTRHQPISGHQVIKPPQAGFLRAFPAQRRMASQGAFSPIHTIE